LATSSAYGDGITNPSIDSLLDIIDSK